MKTFLKIVLIVFVLAVLAAGGAAGWVFYMNQTTEYIDDGGIIFSIKRGDNVSSIAARLENDEIIRNAFILKMYAKLRQTENAFKVGSYRIAAGMTTFDIHDLLISGKQMLERITIRESLRMSQIAAILEENSICGADEFLQACRSKELLEKYSIPGETLEGYLAPDTYFFPKEYPAELIADQLVGAFFARLEIIYPDYKDFTSEELHKKIILSSIVEREYRVVDEAPLIASVFYNRLDIVMHIQSCATIDYIITEIQGRPHQKKILYSDLEIESPYNTYKNYGLPPGPISNPGEVALKAAFYPAETDYLFFVVQDEEAGRHYFSKSLNEHIYARSLYLVK